MTDYPIIFSTPMVQAILGGVKTQTRRIAKLNAAGRVARKGKNWHTDDPQATLACPYGEVGGILWVRETWQGPLGEVVVKTLDLYDGAAFLHLPTVSSRSLARSKRSGSHRPIQRGQLLRRQIFLCPFVQ